MFLRLANVDLAAINIHVQVLVWAYIFNVDIHFSSFGQIPRAELAEPYGSVCLGMICLSFVDCHSKPHTGQVKQQLNNISGYLLSNVRGLAEQVSCFVLEITA